MVPRCRPEFSLTFSTVFLYCFQYWPSSLPALRPDTGKEVAVTIVGKGLFYDYDYESDDEVPKFGHFLNHTEADYIQDDSIKFDSFADGFGLVDMGRYGPFRKSGMLCVSLVSSVSLLYFDTDWFRPEIDRKSKNDFDLKAFAFGNKPAEWPFDVTEVRNGTLENNSLRLLILFADPLFVETLGQVSTDD